MKKRIALVLLLLPMTAQAQNPYDMGGEEMNRMMMQMESCMENIDEARMDALQGRSDQVNAEIRALCAQGKRDKAQQRAVAFGREMAADPTVKQMRRCGEMMQGMLPELDYMTEEEARAGHVCDQQ
jgi:hypothetical protein